MSTCIYPIVGTRHHPPANLICGILPVKSRLVLLAEPGNQFDRNAIAVWVDMDSALEDRRVMDKLAKSGNTDWVNKSAIQLGYIPKDVAAYLKNRGFPNNTEVEAEYYFNFGSNVPHVKFEFDSNGTPGNDA